MPILTIRHVTAYHYKQPVAFGEHRIMLRPRDDEDQKVLESELEIAPESLHPRLNRWAARFLREDGSADTRDLLVDMTQTIKRTFKHVARHERGIQHPVRTLKLGSGSCRDFAVLMIAALRSLGIATRFVSGYLHLADDDDRFMGGNTHAWVQAYIPG